MTEPEQPDRATESALRKGRPSPAPEFGSTLRERLIAADARTRRPARLWLLVAAYISSGVLLLILAALSASGGGPFGS